MFKFPVVYFTNSTFDPCLISQLAYKSNILVFIHVEHRHHERCRVDPVVCTAVFYLFLPLYPGYSHQDGGGVGSVIKV